MRLIYFSFALICSALIGGNSFASDSRILFFECQSEKDGVKSTVGFSVPSDLNGKGTELSGGYPQKPISSKNTKLSISLEASMDAGDRQLPLMMTASNGNVQAETHWDGKGVLEFKTAAFPLVSYTVDRHSQKLEMTLLIEGSLDFDKKPFSGTAKITATPKEGPSETTDSTCGVPRYLGFGK